MTSPTAAWEHVQVQGARLLLTGWAFDADSPGTTTRPLVSVDGETWGSAEQLARADVAAAFPVAGPSAGWSFERSVAPGRHRVCVTVPDVGRAPGADLGCRDVVTSRALPIGNVDVRTAASGVITLSGWALDPDDPTASIEVTAYDAYNRTDRRVTADEDRPDIAVTFPGAGPAHGWSMELPQGSSGGGWTVCATADTGWGTRSLGCGFVPDTHP
ncbi:hypothetical protein [Modestobacter versicolor]|uniref:Uncharacterized protein n=1 Tax=Modestobacter versicolor TaxID=429133 RepID=A0A323VK07_9ACTN|nr:hypothetical protein [Modestobacter versicolor]MBB3678209.1 hypothetical protein [Modestobacter versicolor]PZA23176.1 hypothetical protein DMO24_01040 [Modestobacter versicolor]